MRLEKIRQCWKYQWHSDFNMCWLCKHINQIAEVDFFNEMLQGHKVNMAIGNIIKSHDQRLH